MTEFFLILPEVFLALTLGFVVFGEITYHGEQRRLILPTALMGMGAAFIQTILTYQFGATQVFHQALSVDGLSLFFKLIFILLAALAAITTAHTGEIPPQKRSEYLALILASTVTMCIAASAADMLLIFLCLQGVNIMAYFIAGYGKRSILSIEAAVKFMLFSAVAAGLFLYGLAMLFSVTHTLNIYEMHQILMTTPLTREVMLVVFMLMLLSLSFQFGAFPMYFWAPDVVDGTPTPAVAFLSLGTRATGLVVALRFFINVFAQPSIAQGQWQVLGAIDWTRILGFVSGVTMLVGSLLAIRQRSAKRLVGCIVIAETGVLLLGLLVLDQVGIAALLYNLVIELFSLIGIFYVLSYLYDQLGSDHFDELKGAMGRAVPECICLVLFLLTLVGVPPLPGFIGKFTLVGAAVRHQWLALAGIAMVSMGISTVAIFRLLYSLVGDLRSTLAQPFVASQERQGFLLGITFPIFLLGFFADLVLAWAGKSLGFIFW